MGYNIKKVAVLGAGVMGSGIAAHLANAGVPVLMLDIVPFKADEGEDTTTRAFRDKFAAGALKKLPKQKPSPISSKRALDLIEIGNFDDDLEKIADCDWIVEVIIERMDIKQQLFARVEEHAHENAIVSSNTSGLSIKGMLEGRGENFRKQFLVTHFFNPVRYMKLLELVSGEETSSDVVEAIHDFGENRLGKGIVYGKDTTNFIANRIGVYGMMKTMSEMQKAELKVEEVDKIFGPAMGRPKSAVFRTADVVGLDTFVHVSQNCYDSLTEDEERDVFKIPAFVQKMVDEGMLGSKSGKGFYMKSKNAEGKKEILSLDLNTFEFKSQDKVRYDSLGKARKIEDLGKRIATVMKGEDKAAKFAESVTLATLAYSSRRIPEIADDVVNIDRGMRWGFGWDMGPFQTWDAYGVADGAARMKELGFDVAGWVDDMLAAGRDSFYAVEDGVSTFWDIPSKSSKAVPTSSREVKVEILKRTNKPIETNFSASLWDMGDGVLLLEKHSKMNSIDQGTVEMMHKAIDRAEREALGLVIGNDSQNFSVGANLGAVLMGAQAGLWDMISQLISGFQDANQRMRYSSVPVVTCPTGLVLGGGAEITMGGNAVQVAMETYMGLVEVGVGLIPGGGGNLQLLRNLMGEYSDDKDFDPFPFIKKAFLSIGMANVATSAEEAREAGFLGSNSAISMNRDFVLNDAKKRVIGMSDSFIPPRKSKFRLPGKSGKATIDMLLYDMNQNRYISEYDRFIGSKLAGVLTGGDTTQATTVTEEHLLEIEKEVFLSLCGEKKTQDRMDYMLKNNKPLRN